MMFIESIIQGCFLVFSPLGLWIREGFFQTKIWEGLWWSAIVFMHGFGVAVNALWIQCPWCCFFWSSCWWNGAMIKTSACWGANRISHFVTNMWFLPWSSRPLWYLFSVIQNGIFRDDGTGVNLTSHCGWMTGGCRFRDRHLGLLPAVRPSWLGARAGWCEKIWDDTVDWCWWWWWWCCCCCCCRRRLFDWVEVEASLGLEASWTRRVTFVFKEASQDPEGGLIFLVPV